MVRSRPCDGTDDTTCEAAELGVEVTGQHTKLVKSIGIWEKVASTLDIRVKSAVKIESSNGKAIDRKSRACTRSGWIIRNVVRYARNCLNKVVCIPAVQWKILNALLVNGVTYLRFARVDKSRLSLNGYVLLDRAHVQREARMHVVVSIKAEALLSLRLKARHLYRDVIVTRIEYGETVIA